VTHRRATIFFKGNYISKSSYLEIKRLRKLYNAFNRVRNLLSFSCRNGRTFHRTGLKAWENKKIDEGVTLRIQ
jgi:hypothetical protein